MTVTTYLDQIKKLDCIIANRYEDYTRWVEIADGMGGVSVGERVQTSRNLHRGADAIGNYIDIEREINALKEERQAIIKTIERLPSTEYDLIYKLYVKDYTMKELAYHYGKSYDWVKQRKRNAFLLLQDLLTETEPQTSTERAENAM